MEMGGVGGLCDIVVLEVLELVFNTTYSNLLIPKLSH